ncbi:MAG: hypothetical protein RL693_1658, partial [Verrucomicrobiota bacterium]
MLMGAGLLFLSTSSSLSAQDTKIKIVVDASRDGGTWWFPQEKKIFDPGKPHKGKFFADYLRKVSQEMIEIAPGETVVDQFKEATLVVRFNAYGPPYREEEVTAYKDYVMKGGSVLLVYGAPLKGSADAVADELGVKFGQAAQTPFIKKWANHPITTGLKDVPFMTGSVISGFPESATQLATMANGQSIFGMAPVGKGKIIYLGSFAPLIGMSQPFTERVVAELLKK